MQVVSVVNKYPIVTVVFENHISKLISNNTALIRHKTEYSKTEYILACKYPIQTLEELFHHKTLNL